MIEFFNCTLYLMPTKTLQKQAQKPIEKFDDQYVEEDEKWEIPSYSSNPQMGLLRKMMGKRERSPKRDAKGEKKRTNCKTLES